jgi:hypothetical protein
MKGVQPRVRRTRRGDFQLKLPQVERDVLRSLPTQLRQLLGTDDPALERLFPPAYRDDPLAQADYEEMVHGELISKKLTSIDVMEQTIDTERLTEEQLLAWLGAINDLRLVLGTRLEVTQEMYEEEMPDDDARAPTYAVFAYLGWLEGQVVEALSEGIDPVGQGDEDRRR